MKEKLFNWLSGGIYEIHWKRFLELEEKVRQMDEALLHEDYPKCDYKTDKGWKMCQHGRACFVAPSVIREE